MLKLITIILLTIFTSTVILNYTMTSRGKNTADFICDGTNDDVEIQAAIDVVTSLGGGNVFLLEGTFSEDIHFKVKAKTQTGKTIELTKRFILCHQCKSLHCCNSGMKFVIYISEDKTGIYGCTYMRWGDGLTLTCSVDGKLFELYSLDKRNFSVFYRADVPDSQDYFHRMAARETAIFFNEYYGNAAYREYVDYEY